MTDPTHRDDAAVQRRDHARRRISSITAGALAGGLTLTALTAGLAYAYAPGRDPVSSSSTASSNAGTGSSSPVTGFGDQALQPSDQAPSFGGFGGGHAVSGGS